MYSDILTSSAQRIIEVQDHLRFITLHLPAPRVSTPLSLNTAKGLIFVELYGVIEFTISSTITRTIDQINSEAIKLQELQPPIWAMALNPEFDALIKSQREKWTKRHDLIQSYLANTDVNIANNTMPTNGKNFAHVQLQSLWNAFCINEPIYHDPSFRGRLEDIVVNRNAIAHGTDSAATIGSRLTPIELSARINEVSAFCSYFITVFENYCIQKEFKI